MRKSNLGASYFNRDLSQTHGSSINDGSSINNGSPHPQEDQNMTSQPARSSSSASGPGAILGPSHLRRGRQGDQQLHATASKVTKSQVPKGFTKMALVKKEDDEEDLLGRDNVRIVPRREETASPRKGSSSSTTTKTKTKKKPIMPWGSNPLYLGEAWERKQAERAAAISAAKKAGELGILSSKDVKKEKETKTEKVTQHPPPHVRVEHAISGASNLDMLGRFEELYTLAMVHKIHQSLHRGKKTDGKILADAVNQFEKNLDTKDNPVGKSLRGLIRLSCRTEPRFVEGDKGFVRKNIDTLQESLLGRARSEQAAASLRPLASNDLNTFQSDCIATLDKVDTKFKHSYKTIEHRVDLDWKKFGNKVMEDVYGYHRTHVTPATQEVVAQLNIWLSYLNHKAMRTMDVPSNMADKVIEWMRDFLEKETSIGVMRHTFEWCIDALQQGYVATLRRHITNLLRDFKQMYIALYFSLNFSEVSIDAYLANWRFNHTDLCGMVGIDNESEEIEMPTIADFEEFGRKTEEAEQSHTTDFSSAMQHPQE